jgi:methylated-DNA-[protein]-cysteine S-methyltransferase
MQMDKTYYNSPVGWLEITGNNLGITSIMYSNEPPENIGEIPGCLAPCIQQLQEYFAGARKDFSLLLQPFGTDFQLKVWEELRKIPFGITISYARLAKNMGNEKLTRAVGHANGKNPLNIIIPCHRVIGSGGKLTGYGGGLWRKEWLLKHEKQNISEGLFL